MNYFLSKLFLAAVAASIAVAVGFAFMPVPIDVDMAIVERGVLLVTVDEDGKTRIRERYIVSAPLAGRLLRIDKDAGDSVTAGRSLLATIQPRDPDLLDARALAQAEARVKAAEANVEKARAFLEQAKLAQADAERDWQRAKRLRESEVNAISISEFEDTQNRFRTSGEQLRSAHIAEEIAIFELEQAQAVLIRSRPLPEEVDDGLPPAVTKGDAALGSPQNSNGWTFSIRSPIDGRILRVFQESAAVVTAGTPLLELGDPADLEVEVDVLSRDAVRIRPHNKVFLEHWGGSDPLTGFVRLVEPAAFTKISTLGVEEQRVNVIIDFDDPQSYRGLLGDAFRVEARIVTDQVHHAVKVPTSALFRDGERWAVFAVVDDVARSRSVTIGHENGLEAEVLEGLDEGDVVVLHPSDQIEDGIRLRSREP